MRLLLAFALACLALAAQAPDLKTGDAAELQIREHDELSQAVNEAGSSPIDLIRALETHLGKYPETKQRASIEQTLAKSATDLNDNVRIVFYGEKVLSTLSPGEKDNVTLLDRVTRALLDSSDAEYARRALEYTKRYEADLVALRKQNPPNHLTTGQWIEDLDRSQARVLTLEAQATGNLGDQAAAAKIAMKSWEAYPTGEGAREAALWLIKLGRDRQAVEFYADAFTLEDARTTAADRAKDRKRLGELYLKINGSEDGLGEVILKAYDRTSASLDERRAILKANDPNSVAANIEDFVLPAVADGVSSLAISSLQGKILVLDFWATWCVPCRAQQPLLEKVKKHFEDVKDIVFLPVNADDDPSLVAPFLKEQEWPTQGYFEAGMADKLTIGALPTVVVVDSSGKIFSKIAGFIPERFEQMLTQRIEEAREAR